MKLTQTAAQIECTAYEWEFDWFMESFNEKCFQAKSQKLGLHILRPSAQDNH